MISLKRRTAQREKKTAEIVCVRDSATLRIVGKEIVANRRTPAHLRLFFVVL